jgi:hypothetical protein
MTVSSVATINSEKMKNDGNSGMTDIDIVSGPPIKS